MAERIQEMGLVPLDPKGLPNYLQQLSTNFSARIRGIEQSFFEITYAEPLHIAEGTVRYADGTSWDPGSGAAWYQYRSAAWVWVGGGSHLVSPVFTTPQINDTSADHQYVFAVNELAADRIVTLPLLTGNDEFVFKDHAVTLTGKTLTNPTINAAAFTGNLTGTPTWTQAVVLTQPDINGGTIDGATVGASSANTGAFTTLGASDAVTFTSTVVMSGAASPSFQVTDTTTPVTAQMQATNSTVRIGTVTAHDLYFLTTSRPPPPSPLKLTLQVIKYLPAVVTKISFAFWKVAKFTSPPVIPSTTTATLAVPIITSVSTLVWKKEP